ncbi:MAG: alpha/beta hydrolase [Thermoplasmata archaeon]|nr:alpha/beta hydrolase [Thermoplasmata archaeon]
MPYTEFSVHSSRGDAELHCVEWAVEKPIATVQISHGMIEHILRYADFAEYLNGRGFAVIGHDHLGHGSTSPDDHGLIAENDGDEHLVEDVYLVTQKVAEKYPGVPHFILGHSMGSFVVRRYLTRYGDMVDGAVIVGTGNQSGFVVAFAKLVASVLVKMKGPRYISPFLNKSVLGGNDSKFSEPDMPNRWISRDPEAIAKYNADPYCTFDFTVAGYRDLMTLIQKVIRRVDIEKVPKGLPIILLSGAADPVGESGKGVERAKAGMEKAGLSPEMKLYEGARHEILNETNREEVYRDIGDWLESHVSQ